MFHEVENTGDAERRKAAEQGVSAGRAKSRRKANDKAALQGTPDAKQTDRSNWSRNHDAQYEAAIENADFFEQFDNSLAVRDLWQSLALYATSTLFRLFLAKITASKERGKKSKHSYRYSRNLH
jgi:hypothetical protein